MLGHFLQLVNDPSLPRRYKFIDRYRPLAWRRIVCAGLWLRWKRIRAKYSSHKYDRIRTIKCLVWATSREYGQRYFQWSWILPCICIFQEILGKKLLFLEETVQVTGRILYCNATWLFETFLGEVPGKLEKFYEYFCTYVIHIHNPLQWKEHWIKLYISLWYSWEKKSLNVKRCRANTVLQFVTVPMGSCGSVLVWRIRDS